MYQNNYNPPLKSSLTTLLLCLFFGFVGAHRFYTGHVLVGVIYILSGGFFGIGWFVDLIFIIFGGFQDSDGNPLR
jgi:TM2 domain-containing membrane protein YozV